MLAVLMSPFARPRTASVVIVGHAVPWKTEFSSSQMPSPEGCCCAMAAAVVTTRPTVNTSSKQRGAHDQHHRRGDEAPRGDERFAHVRVQAAGEEHTRVQRRYLLSADVPEEREYRQCETRAVGACEEGFCGRAERPPWLRVAEFLDVDTEEDASEDEGGDAAGEEDPLHVYEGQVGYRTHHFADHGGFCQDDEEAPTAWEPCRMLRRISAYSCGPSRMPKMSAAISIIPLPVPITTVLITTPGYDSRVEHGQKHMHPVP